MPWGDNVSAQRKFSKILKIRQGDESGVWSTADAVNEKVSVSRQVEQDF